MGILYRIVRFVTDVPYGCLSFVLLQHCQQVSSDFNTTQYCYYDYYEAAWNFYINTIEYADISQPDACMFCWSNEYFLLCYIFKLPVNLSFRLPVIWSCGVQFRPLLLLRVVLNRAQWLKYIQIIQCCLQITVSVLTTWTILRREMLLRIVCCSLIKSRSNIIHVMDMHKNEEKIVDWISKWLLFRVNFYNLWDSCYFSDSVLITGSRISQSLMTQVLECLYFFYFFFIELNNFSEFEQIRSNFMNLLHVVKLLRYSFTFLKKDRIFFVNNILHAANLM